MDCKQITQIVSAVALNDEQIRREIDDGQIDRLHDLQTRASDILYPLFNSNLTIRINFYRQMMPTLVGQGMSNLSLPRFKSDREVVKLGERFAIVDIFGEQVGDEVYDIIYNLQEIDKFLAIKDGKGYILDKYGQKTIPSENFDGIFVPGVFNKLIGVMNRKNSFFIDEQGQRFGEYFGSENGWIINENFALLPKNGKYMLFDKNLERVGGEYSDDPIYTDRFPIVMTRDRHRVNFLVGEDGKRINEDEYDWIAQDPEISGFLVKKDDQYYCINNEGETISPIYEEAKTFEGDVACGKQNGKWSFFGRDFKSIGSDLKFDKVYNFNNKVALVKSGSINMIYDFESDQTASIADIGVSLTYTGVLVAESDNQEFLINSSGRPISAEYDKILKDFHLGNRDYLAGKVNGRFRLINTKTGQEVPDCEFDYIASTGNADFLTVQRDGQVYAIDYHGNKLFDVGVAD